jgi:NADH-ubiquinone oxidoreductase chain 5
MGNLTTQFPITSSCITIANLALCGFPFIAGFYSKDLIIEIASMQPVNILILIMAISRIGLTRFYTIRFSIATILSPSNSTP